MSRLGDLLHARLAMAAKLNRTQGLALRNGLQIRVSAAPDTLTLWRNDGDFSGEKAEREGRVCARHLGWTDYTLDWEQGEVRRFLKVKRGEPLL
ncbi:hypothetical protein [Deinococcus peraridilitoris]|uniref:Uncharacterized protein n=1 Tax=Deinococcus peraridilitoris (strain DSM 19664 / LMG 22246 / CIP 109416 / KR-200) TaxID=937777 RepID=L0A2A6_DEIPD|nr:hypothetical protein [Deinococcus peraridilitoris]AFZ67115.1 hypothetical protein Deipe_1574 [Deinococcus peraridilitoris DSM 19664]